MKLHGSHLPHFYYDEFRIGAARLQFLLLALIRIQDLRVYDDDIPWEQLARRNLGLFVVITNETVLTSAAIGGCLT